MDKNFFKPYRIGLIAIIFISCSITFYKFHKIILHPTEYYLSGGGDAYKTYFCGMYHIKYDSTYHHSQQMNHPYGDHINFIDIQPVVVNFMKFLSNIFDYDLSDYYIPAIDYFILISLTIAAILLYFLLVNLRLPVWYSVILSIAITYLSPQIARFNGHFGLSYIFVIPTILYLLHKFEINRSFKLSALIAIFTILFGGLHFYYVGIIILFLAAYFFVDFLTNPSKQRLIINTLYFCLQGVVPFIILQLWLAKTAIVQVSDRTSYPYGLYAYRALWEGVFTSIKVHPLFQYIDKNIIHIRHVEFEGTSYVGLIGLIAFVYLLYVSIANHPKGNIFYAKRSKQEYYLNNIFWASIILLLFAHGFPFLIPGFEWMTDYLSGLRQFRSLGRFAWVFYYVINIVAFYKLYRWAVRIKKRSIGFVVLFIPLLNICLESGKFFNEFQSNMESAIDLKKYAVDHWSKHVDIGDYQAIMCLPAYHNGSENIWYGGMDGHTFAYSLVNSQITGLPLMSSYIGRASISQTLNQLQFIMEPTQSSLLVKDLKDERPILVWILKKNFENEKNEYKWIFENSEKIYANETDLLFRLNYLILNDYLKQKKHDIQKEIQNLSPNAEDRLITNDSAFNNVIFYDYDQNESSKQFLGSNCIEKPSNENYILFDNKIPNVDTSKVYDINFWCFVNKDRYATNLFRIKIYNENQELFKDEKSLFSNIKSIRDGWALISYKINFHDVNAKLSVSVGNENIRHEMMYIDNFMILPEKVDVYLQNDNYLMKNNLWYDK